MQLPEGARLDYQIRTPQMPTIPDVEKQLNSVNIFTMASGQVGDELKFYFHCQLADKSGYAMAEIVFKQSLQTISGVIKTTRGDLAQQFHAKFSEGVKPFTN